MAWFDVRGHDAVVDRFRQMLRRGRCASSFLFLGPDGVGKHLFARRLTACLFCSERPDEALDACGTCSNCRLLASGSHPDLVLIERPADKNFIPVATFIGAKERRMREGLIHAISLKPNLASRRIAIINDADFLNEEGANCLLKTLEEPPPRSLLILIGTSADRQLPTILSRCQTVRFEKLPTRDLAELLVAQELTSDPALAEQAARDSNGGLARARLLLDDDLLRMRDAFVQRLSRPHEMNSGVVDEVMSFLEAAGKETSRRRVRAKWLVDVAIDYYTEQLRGACQAEVSPEFAACQIDVTLAAGEQIDRNANLATVVGGWLDALAATPVG